MCPWPSLGYSSHSYLPDVYSLSLCPWPYTDYPELNHSSGLSQVKTWKAPCIRVHWRKTESAFRVNVPKQAFQCPPAKPSQTLEVGKQESACHHPRARPRVLSVVSWDLRLSPHLYLDLEVSFTGPSIFLKDNLLCSGQGVGTPPGQACSQPLCTHTGH